MWVERHRDDHRPAQQEDDEDIESDSGARGAILHRAQHRRRRRRRRPGRIESTVRPGAKQTTTTTHYHHKPQSPVSDTCPILGWSSSPIDLSGEKGTILSPHISTSPYTTNAPPPLSRRFVRRGVAVANRRPPTCPRVTFTAKLVNFPTGAGFISRLVRHKRKTRRLARRLRTRCAGVRRVREVE